MRVVSIAGSASRLRQLELVDDVGRVKAAIRDAPPAAAGRVPAIIILGGARTGHRAVELVDPDLPLTVAALDHAWTGAASARGLGTVAGVATVPRDLLRTAVALRDLARILERDPRVERVYLVGASLGSPIASAVAAAERPAGLVLLYGFADHGAVLDHRLRRDVPWTIVRRPLSAAGAALTANFDAVRTLPRACGTPVLVVASADDRELPRRSQDALWNAACAPRWRVVVRGGHLQSGRDPELLRRATRAVTDWLAERERAAVAIPQQGH